MTQKLFKDINVNVQKFLFKGNERSLKAKKNILLSFFVKFIFMVLGIITIRINLDYLSKETYGIWVTIASFISWFDFFDFGLGNGFRNKFAQSMARKENSLARVYVSTTYALISLITLFMILVFVMLHLLVDWNSLFNAPANLNYEIRQLMVFVFTSFSLRFVFKLIATLLTADQHPAYKDIFDLISRMVSLSVLIVLIKTSDSSVLYLGITYSVVPILVLVFANFYFFAGKYKTIRPSLKYVELSRFKELMNLGIKFFIIHLATLVMFSTDNFIIAHIFSPAEVTPYDITYKYFRILTMSAGIIMTPFWSAFTDAYTKKDFDWIKRIVKKLKRLWLVLLGLNIIMVAMSPFVYDFFDKDENIEIPFLLTISMAFYVIYMAYSSIFMSFLNGVGKIKIQFYAAIPAALLNIPLSIFLARTLNLGLAGIIIATIICASFGPLFGPYQYRKIITGKAKGILNE